MADSVLRLSPIPVIVVPPAVLTAWPPGGPRRIAVPLDESSLAEAALPPAEALARSVAADILLVEVVPFPPYSMFDEGAAMIAFEPDKELAASHRYLAEVATRLRSRGVQVRTHSELEHPAYAIARIADSARADLIIMATHGRSGLARLLLGSVATGTLQRTRVPLMLLGPVALDSAVAPEPEELEAAHPVG